MKLYAETKNNGGDQKVYMNWIQFRPWFRSSGAKVSSFIIQKFYIYNLAAVSLSHDQLWTIIEETASLT